LAAVLLASTPAAAAPIARHPGNAKHTVVVGSKNFTEQFVLGEIYAQALHAAGYRVRRKLGYANEKAAFRALRKGSISAYPEYTGLVLSSFYGYKLGRLPRSGGASYRAARRRLTRDGVAALPRAPANDTLTLAMTRDRATTLGNPRSISDLKGKTGRLTIAGYPGCRTQVICLKGLKRRYKLGFRRFRSTRSPYGVLAKGTADVAFAFTTDPSLTRGFVGLRDDRHLFPSFHVTLLFSKRLLARLGPDARRVVARVQEPLTTTMLRKLDARVVYGKQSEKRVARDYLREAGFVKR
jgi:glycine betaine/choline ABC-type transport system substrate-binding protein